jgi:anhydro-N-acetylmuramic acid kinase
MRTVYPCIGLMSGTSLDGLDIAVCNIVENDGKYSFEIKDATTIAYSDEWKNKLATAHKMSALELALLHVELGRLHGSWVKHYCTTNDYFVEFIASHGHTIFHQPDKSLTLQIGSAPHIAAVTGTPVVADFRTGDVARGGQGAPLVPIGDRLFFGEYDYCLNLGGIANISFEQTLSDDTHKRIAYDVCVCNMALNFYAEQLGKAYDKDGAIARSGVVNQALLQALNSLPFFTQAAPKSLGKEFFDSEFLPLMQASETTVEDKLATLVEHMAMQLSAVLQNDKRKKILVTGGGAFNQFLLERLQAHTEVEVVIPDERTVQFKEALIFALLGLLRWTGHVNCLASVTGTKRDSIGGAIYLS